MEALTFSGPSLAGGRRARLRLQARPGPLCFLQQGAESRAGEERSLRELHAVLTTGEGLKLSADGFVLRHAEPLLAALALLRVEHGLLVLVEGDAPPLLDGSLGDLAAALRALGVGSTSMRRRVRECAETRMGVARLRFETGDTPVVAVPTLAVPIDGRSEPFGDVQLAVREVNAASIERAPDGERARRCRELLALLAWVGGAPRGRVELALDGPLDGPLELQPLLVALQAALAPVHT